MLRHFHFKGCCDVFYSIINNSNKEYPRFPTNVGFPLAQAMGFAVVYNNEWGMGVYKATVKVVVRKQFY